MSSFLHIIKYNRIKFGLLLIWLLLLILQSGTADLIAQYGTFLFLGISGAIFANSTGAGGGVVFVPFFKQLELSNQTIIATSFAIQCCGMTAGAISWWNYYRTRQYSNQHWRPLKKVLGVSVPCSVIGILVAQFVLGDITEHALNSLHLYFGLFSIVLAFGIFASIPLMKREASRHSLFILDFILLSFIAFTGGIVTAWLSVGVGELVAVYLILRGFNVSVAIAVAVILSAFSVWAAIYYHVEISKAIYWQILFFAGAGAVVGGLLAKYLVLYFSPTRLKVFFASWVLIMGVAGLPIMQ